MLEIFTYLNYLHFLIKMNQVFDLVAPYLYDTLYKAELIKHVIPSPDLQRYFIENNLPEQYEYYRYTPKDLYITLLYRSLEITHIVEFLLQFVDIHADDDRALCSSAQNGYFNTVELLLKHNANISINN